MNQPVRCESAEHQTGIARSNAVALIVFELVLIAIVIHFFAIESQRYLLPVFCLATVGFIVNALIPRENRRIWFAVLSMASVLFVLGWENGLLLLAIGAGLILVCRSPIEQRYRLALLVLVACGLVGARSQWPSPIWPILGSMFMFRLALYLFETRNSKEHRPFVDQLAYFLMLPNVCFPLFPVVDYRRLGECWYDESEITIHQRGVCWIVRGILQLLLYRWIKLFILPAQHEIDDFPKLAMFMAANYGLYLQVSGQFHLITGILHLFGFNLPPTHQWYFLATSFNDIWRRINIYWKEFLTKVVFFPTFHALRIRGVGSAWSITIGVFVAFVATWLLHSWQTFWLLGRFPLTLRDAGLWLAAGSCVALNSMLDVRRKTASENKKWLGHFRVAMQTVGMFALISLFWALWTEPEFMTTLHRLWSSGPVTSGVLRVALILSGATSVLAIVFALSEWTPSRGWPINNGRQLSVRESIQLHVAGLGVLVVASSSWFNSLLSSDMSAIWANFRQGTITREVASNELRSYYEDLNSAAIQAGPLIRSLTPVSESRTVQALGYERVSRKGDAYLEVELIPNIQVDLDGNPFSVNHFGMRDRKSLLQEKPQNVKRIAFLGSSIVMGYGVADDDVFARLFETHLNSNLATDETRFEVLNFGVGKHWPLNRLFQLRKNVVKFSPDAVYYFAHQDELTGLARHLAKLISERQPVSFPRISQIVERAGISSDLAWGAIQGQLELRQAELLEAVYASIVDECQRQRALPVYIYLPIPGTTNEDPSAKLLPLAEKTGFVVADLTDWSSGYGVDELFVPADQVHPHADGHRLIARALNQTADSRPETLPRDAR